MPGCAARHDGTRSRDGTADLPQPGRSASGPGLTIDGPWSPSLPRGARCPGTGRQFHDGGLPAASAWASAWLTCFQVAGGVAPGEVSEHEPARPRACCGGDVAQACGLCPSVNQRWPPRLCAAGAGSWIEGQDRLGAGAVQDRVTGGGVRPVQDPSDGTLLAEEHVQGVQVEVQHPDPGAADAACGCAGRGAEPGWRGNLGEQGVQGAARLACGAGLACARPAAGCPGAPAGTGETAVIAASSRSTTARSPTRSTCSPASQLNQNYRPGGPGSRPPTRRPQRPGPPAGTLQPSSYHSITSPAQ